MHLLTQRQTVLNAFFYGWISIFSLWGTVQCAIDQSVFGVIMYVLMGLFCALHWKWYIQAFKRRAYDREYAKAKKELLQTLQTLLSSPGMVAISAEGEAYVVYRGLLKLFKNHFTIDVFTDAEVFYNELPKRNVLISNHSYSISNLTLYVMKSFDTIGGVLIDDDEDRHEPDVDDVFEQSKLTARGAIAIFKENVKASRDIPEGLLYASPSELEKLNSSLLANV